MTRADSQHYRRQLTVAPRGLAEVRRAVGACLRCWGWGDLDDPAGMCVTELLTNVYRHAGSNDCVLDVRASPSGVRIVVSDDSPQLPVLHVPDWFAESGRGMFLLSRTADAWGADPTNAGKEVWIEFRAASREVLA